MRKQNWIGTKKQPFGLLDCKKITYDVPGISSLLSRFYSWGLTLVGVQYFPLKYGHCIFLLASSILFLLQQRMTTLLTLLKTRKSYLSCEHKGKRSAASVID